MFPSLNKFLCPLCIPTILNRFLKSLIFWNLHVPKIVQFYFHKDICSFEAAMASEASGNVCFITASNVPVHNTLPFSPSPACSFYLSTLVEMSISPHKAHLYFLMRNDPNFPVGYAPKIKSGASHNIKFQKTKFP